MIKPLICKKCGSTRDVGRKLCRPCNLERLKEAAKGRPRYTWNKKCSACSNEFRAWRKDQALCIDCYKTMQGLSAESISTNNYVFTNTPGRTRHRNIAEQLLGRKLQTNEVVHHMDDDPKNNSVNNLVVLDRRTHGTLHRYLDMQRVIIEKSMNENSENCWNTFIVPMTTTWLETTSVKVIKLWEIRQPAAEPLSNEEGSETMHGTSHVEDDIVQTTTEKASES